MEIEYKQQWLTMKAENQAERVQLKALAQNLMQDDTRQVVEVTPPGWRTLKDPLVGVREVAIFIGDPKL